LLHLADGTVPRTGEKHCVLFFSLQAQLSAYKSQLTQEDGRERRPMYRHNQQLEELRNLQDRLTQEKEAWQREKDSEEKYIEEKKAELHRLQVRCFTDLLASLPSLCEFLSFSDIIVKL